MDKRMLLCTRIKYITACIFVTFVSGHHVWSLSILLYDGTNLVAMVTRRLFHQHYWEFMSNIFLFKILYSNTDLAYWKLWHHRHFYWCITEIMSSMRFCILRKLLKNFPMYPINDGFSSSSLWWWNGPHILLQWGTKHQCTAVNATGYV